MALSPYQRMYRVGLQRLGSGFAKSLKKQRKRPWRGCDWRWAQQSGGSQQDRPRPNRSQNRGFLCLTPPRSAIRWKGGGRLFQPNEQVSNQCPNRDEQVGPRTCHKICTQDGLYNRSGENQGQKRRFDAAEHSGIRLQTKPSLFRQTVGHGSQNRGGPADNVVHVNPCGTPRQVGRQAEPPALLGCFGSRSEDFAHLMG